MEVLSCVSAIASRITKAMNMWSAAVNFSFFFSFLGYLARDFARVADGDG